MKRKCKPKGESVTKDESKKKKSQWNEISK